jgi:hypothetical protein
MGPLVKSGLPPQASEPDANLEAALERLRKAAGLAGAGVERAHPDEIRKRCEGGP